MGVSIRTPKPLTLEITFLRIQELAIGFVFLEILIVFGLIFAACSWQRFNVSCTKYETGSSVCIIDRSYYFGLLNLKQTVSDVEGIRLKERRSRRGTNKELVLATRQGDVPVLGFLELAVDKQVRNRILTAARSGFLNSERNEFSIDELSVSKPAFAGYVMIAVALLGLFGCAWSLCLPARTVLDKGKNICFIRACAGSIRSRRFALSLIRKIEFLDATEAFQAYYPKMADRLKKLIPASLGTVKGDHEVSAMAGLRYLLNDATSIVQIESGISQKDWAKALRAMRDFSGTRHYEA